MPCRRGDQTASIRRLAIGSPLKKLQAFRKRASYFRMEWMEHLAEFSGCIIPKRLILGFRETKQDLSGLLKRFSS